MVIAGVDILFNGKATKGSDGEIFMQEKT